MVSICETTEAINTRDKVLESIDDYFIQFDQPYNFKNEDPTNALVQFEASYHNLCAALESNGSDTKGITVMQLYSRLNYFKELNSNKENK